MAGRTALRFSKVFYAGYDLTGYARDWGEIGTEAEEVDMTTIGDAVGGALAGKFKSFAGPVNGVLDNTAVVGAHTILATLTDTKQIITVGLGDRAALAQGDVCFNAEPWQNSYRGVEEAGAVNYNLTLSPEAITAASLQKQTGWGLILNANAARTGVNAASGVDHPTQAATAFGGTLVYQVTAGNGTATLSVDDSADNAAFAALSGATSGSINCAVVSAGVVAISRTATVRRYLRWQIVFGTATTVTFVTAFCRNYF